MRTGSMLDAAIGNNFEALLFLRKKNLSGCTTFAVQEACEHGHFEVAQWFIHYYPQSFDPRAVRFRIQSQVAPRWKRLLSQLEELGATK